LRFFNQRNLLKTQSFAKTSCGDVSICLSVVQQREYVLSFICNWFDKTRTYYIKP